MVGKSGLPIRLFSIPCWIIVAVTFDLHAIEFKHEAATNGVFSAAARSFRKAYFVINTLRSGSRIARLLTLTMAPFPSELKGQVLLFWQ
jgi:hypothetical protein